MNPFLPSPVSPPSPRAHSPRGEEQEPGSGGPSRREPIRPPRPCRKPGCNTLTTDRSGYCDEHRSYGEQRRRDFFKKLNEQRQSASRRGYGAEWRKLREAKLKANPLCEKCGAPASVVHHKDHNQFNDFWDNLESVCRACHEEHHGRKKKSEHVGSMTWQGQKIQGGSDCRQPSKS